MAWRVTFHGEGHQGFQGPYREALSGLCQELISPKLPLFVPCSNNASGVANNMDKYVPRPSSTSPEHVRASCPQTVKCAHFRAFMWFLGNIFLLLCRFMRVFSWCVIHTEGARV